MLCSTALLRFNNKQTKKKLLTFLSTSTAAWTQTQPNQDNLFGGQTNFGIQSSNIATGNAFGSLNSTDAGFSLQKPPVGLKRNKH